MSLTERLGAGDTYMTTQDATAEVTNERVIAASKMIKQLFKLNSSGGNAHIVIDDGNTEDEHIDFCIAQARSNPLCYPAQQCALELELLAHLRALNVYERISAIDLQSKWV